MQLYHPEMRSCILSKFYIKPQPGLRSVFAPSRCILSKFYIKPQLSDYAKSSLAVVSYRNSTSNHNDVNATTLHPSVVSYRNSTSNHNFATCWSDWCCVVSYRNSTSNHNFMECNQKAAELYLIEILHQTTTLHIFHKGPEMLYLIEILHQTTTVLGGNATLVGCILSKFYIKPQLCRTYSIPEAMLYLIEILHQTTTSPYS